MFKQFNVFRDKLKRRIAKKSTKELKLYYKNGRLALVICALFLMAMTILSLGYDSKIGFYLTLISILIMFISYHFHIMSVIESVPLILTEELDVERMLPAIAMLKPDTMALPTLNYATAYLVAGDWEKAGQYLHRLKPKRLERAVTTKFYIIRYLGLDYQLRILQGQEVDLDLLLNQLNNLTFKNDIDKDMAEKTLISLQAMADIESGKVNTYFETAEARHRLDRLIFDYYLGRNALLEGKEAEAREQFEKVAQTNKDDIYFVRQAKKYLEEL